jgi:predicted nucleotidyltransferase
MEDQKIKKILIEFKDKIQQKYPLLEMRLFGSAARGDFSASSDIDVMVKLPKVNREIEEDLFDMAYDFELEYDCVIDVIVLPQDIDEGIPIYQNIMLEGVVV